MHPYHAHSAQQVLRTLRTSTRGLSGIEAHRRLKVHGVNVLSVQRQWSLPRFFYRTLTDPLLLILSAAFVVSIAASNNADAILIGIVIAISVTVSFVQEYKANQSLERLRSSVRQSAKVLRDGLERIVDAKDLVPGDMLLVGAGDVMTADARIMEAHDIQVIEAPLTGESHGVDKETRALPEETILAERRNCLYASSTIARGSGKAVVFATGSATQIGAIARLVATTSEAITPLQTQLHSLSRNIGMLLVVLTTLVFVVGLLAGEPLITMFVTSLAVAVAAVPEGLLPALTVILSVGMRRLATRKAYVRRLLAAETLGSITVICTDKTGTLTEGAMRVVSLLTASGPLKFYDRPHEIPSELPAIAREAHWVSALCHNAVVERRGKNPERWAIRADATEKALVLANASARINESRLRKEYKRVAEIPFDSSYKYMATLHHVKEGRTAYRVAFKGAPDRLLHRCSEELGPEGRVKFGENARARWLRAFEEMAEQGFRVVAVATKDVDQTTLKHEDLQECTLVGLFVLQDPIRRESRSMIALCAKAGIRTIMVTGDHQGTAMTVAKTVGLPATSKTLVEGAALDALNDRQLQKLVASTTVFARVEPAHKLRIVKALQSNGEIVAMTGDGVNDAPALKAASIGVAVGSGTDVAKEVSDLVLMDNNFATIVEAVRQGRMMVHTIQKVILYLVTDSFTEITVVMGSLLLGLPIPLVPAQILWIKMMEDTSPAMALAFDRVDDGVMDGPPRDPAKPLLSRNAWRLIVGYSFIINVVLLAIYVLYLRGTGDLRLARTVTFVGLGIGSLFTIYSVRGLYQSILTMNPFTNRWLNATTVMGFLLLAAAVSLPPLTTLLQTTPLDSSAWMILLGYGVGCLTLYELLKRLLVHRSTF